MTERDEQAATPGPAVPPAPVWTSPGALQPPTLQPPTSQPEQQTPDAAPAAGGPASTRHAPDVALPGGPASTQYPGHAQQVRPPSAPLAWGMPPVSQQPAPVPPPAGGPWRPPRRLEAIPGTQFAVAYLDVPRSTSGPSIGALAAGIGSLLVMTLAGCFGAIGAQGDSGVLAGGAFGILAGLLGTAGVGLGVVGLRQVRRLGVRGRGLAIAGIACGGAGVVLTLAILFVLLLTD